MSKIEVDAIEPQSGTSLTIGASGDTVTVPSGVTFDASNATTTLPSNVVTTTGTQTLTNKTIDASQLTDSTISLAKLSATGTASASTFLRGDNSWGTVSSDYVLLASQTVSGTSSAVSFDGYFSSTYDIYKCVFYDLDLSAINQNILVRFRVSNADYTTAYRWSSGYTASITSSGTANASSAGGVWNTTSISQLNGDPVGTTLGDYICQGELTFIKPLDTSNYKMVKTDFIYYISDGTALQHRTGFGTNWDVTSALSGFTIYPLSTTFNRGTFKLYGIKWKKY